MKKISFLSLAFIILVAFAGCKKNNSASKPSCRINQITETNQNKTNVYTISYNADGKISSVTFTGGSVSYAYSDDSIVVTSRYSDSTVVTAIYTLGSDGKPINLHVVFSNSSDRENGSYFYSNGQLSKAVGTASYETNPADEYFWWKDGNLDSIVDTYNQDTTTYTCSYYTDKLYQPGDYIFYDAVTGDGEINPFPFLLLLQNRNLLKSFTSRQSIHQLENADITYSFDTDDKITSMNIQSTLTNTTSISYQYDCH